ncbi:carboxypeptidase M32 [Thermophilibacter sp.]
MAETSTPRTDVSQTNAALSNPRADLESLDELERRLFSLRYAIDEIGSLGPVIDPPRATEERAEALAELERQRAQTLSNPLVGGVLERLGKCPELLSDTQKAQLRVLGRDRDELVRVPADEQAAFSRLTCEAEDVWRRAKAASDWESFAPYLDRIVAARVNMAKERDGGRDPYDVWLDDFEPGCDRAFYDTFFSQVKDVVVPLLADCSASRHQPSRACVEGSFDVERQWALARDLVRLEGVDEDALWLGRTEHPFTGGPSTGFVLIAGHVHEDDVLSNAFTMLHEGGHALYEQGVDPAYRYTSLKGGTSMGMHEAQSRFFENYVGRSEAFARPLLDALARHFPGRFARVTPRQLYLAENRAEPGLIRTEADELTYPLHILVRYEIEQLLFSGEATAADVPRLWAEKYRAYLGVEVPDDARGALQDTHWANGEFGYFPTYALGSAFGAQLRHAMVAGGVDLEGACAAGDLAPVRDWLRERIWRWGRAKDSFELIRDACGEVFSPTYYTDYLAEKFSALYRLGA